MHRALISDRPLVFAHRGGSKIGPENTIVAFDRGLAAGADGLELDVHLSRDGVVVVHHDPLLDRTTRARGPLINRTAAELAELDVPTLRAVLARYRNTPMIVEMKGSSSALAVAVVDEVQRAGAADHICLGSFSVGALRAARNVTPAIATSAGKFEVRVALYRSWMRLSPGRVPYRAFQVPEVNGGTRIVSRRFVEMAHKSGLAVQVWTVDAPDDIRRLLEWGVDGIISDRPDVAADVVKNWAADRPSSVDGPRSTD